MAPPGEAREGYELWRPNREKASSKTMKAIIAFVLLASAALLVIITLGGWERLQSPGIGVATIGWAGLYVAFALAAINWVRGLLPVAATLAVIMIIFAAVSAPGWFARDKPGLESPAIPEDLLGLLTLVLIPVQILLVAVAMIGFNQEWHIEEERPIPGGPHDDGGTGHADDPGLQYSEDPAEAADDASGEQRSSGWSPPSTSSA